MQVVGSSKYQTTIDLSSTRKENDRKSSQMLVSSDKTKSMHSTMTASFTKKKLPKSEFSNT